MTNAEELELIDSVELMIKKQARRTEKNAAKFEDACQEGRIAALRAARKHDAKLSKFSTYAYAYIQNSVMDYHRRETPLYVSEHLWKAQQEGDPSVFTKMEDIGFLCEKDMPKQEEDFDTPLMIRKMLGCLGRLSATEHYLIARVYGIGCDAVPQTELAKEFDRSTQAISDRVQGIQRKLHRLMEAV